MDEIKKASYETQAQVRHNAEEFRNTLNDLYNWEKEIKEQEQQLHRKSPAAEQSEHLKTIPVRSHVLDQATNKQQPQNVNNSATTTKDDNQTKTATEKGELPCDPNEEKRKDANQMKDLGNKYVKLGEHENAINAYTAAIEIYPEDPIFFCNRALCFLKLERYSECIEDCERAIDIDSLAVKAYYRRMQANEYLGNNMDALKDCTTVLMIEPKNSEAKKSLERINERLRKNAKSATGPNFSELQKNTVDILPIAKPPYKRSSKPLRRVPIADIVGPKDTKNLHNTNLQISDEDIDKLFNSNCGPYEEITDKTKIVNNKKVAETQMSELTKTVMPATSQETVKDNKTVKSPTIKNEISTELNKTTISPEKNNITSAITTIECQALPPAPTSTAQFYSNWKELTKLQKYQYLKSIPISNLGKILGAGFDSDTLTDILYILHDYYLPENEATTTATLLEVSKNNQIGILTLLMSSDEHKVLLEIVNSIKESNANASAANLITKNFNLC